MTPEPRSHPWPACSQSRCGLPTDRDRFFLPAHARIVRALRGEDYTNRARVFLSQGARALGGHACGVGALPSAANAPCIARSRNRDCAPTYFGFAVASATVLSALVRARRARELAAGGLGPRCPPKTPRLLPRARPAPLLYEAAAASRSRYAQPRLQASQFRETRPSLP